MEELDAAKVEFTSAASHNCTVPQNVSVTNPVVGPPSVVGAKTAQWTPKQVQFVTAAAAAAERSVGAAAWIVGEAGASMPAAA